MSQVLTEMLVTAAHLDPARWITANDHQRSATATMLGDLRRALAPLASRRCNRLLDIGCGFGGLTKFVGTYCGASEVYGIDVDAAVLAEAADKGVITHNVDVSRDPLPFPDAHFDLVLSLGMLDYLPFFDDLIREILRATRPGGHVLISLPNLASWHNRLSLLMGYQPRDIEVSRETVAGVHPYYRQDRKPTGHIHTVTGQALRELMDFHGFRAVRMSGGRPSGRRKSWLLVILDALFGLNPSLARRFFYLGAKPQQ